MAWRLYKNASRDDIVSYLGVFKESIMKEFNALLEANNKFGGVGEFTVPLIFFSLVLELSEYLKGDRPRHEEEELRFITDYFDAGIYSPQVVKWFFHMYRHGLCHRFHPQNLIISWDGQPAILHWSVFSDKDGGKRADGRRGFTNDFEFKDDSGERIELQKSVTMEHFNIIEVYKAKERPSRPEYAGCYLPISINALAEDLITAIEKYISEINKDDKMLTRFRGKISNIHFSAKEYPPIKYVKY